jgi:cell division protein FtsZ
MEENQFINFDLPKESNSIIKVIGVGGGGCNAVDHMYRQGIKGVDFIVCNTDQQALDKSPVPVKIALGKHLTEGLGAGSIPEVGRDSAIESIEEVRNVLGKRTKMVFITAGMGGGTGTGAAPVIAASAKEMGILTVGIVTVPFFFEGKKRKSQADAGLEEMKRNVDTLLVICNDKLREIYGDLKMTNAFGRADDILTTAAKGIADIITTTLHINTDFADIETVLKDSGVALMGSASASGDDRALKAMQDALSSPLLNDSNIKGARHILLNVTCGSGENEATMDEFGEITDFLQDAAGQTAEVIQGYGIDETLGNSLKVTIIATGFRSNQDLGMDSFSRPEKKIHVLEPNPEPKMTSDSEKVASNVSHISLVAPEAEIKPIEQISPIESILPLVDEQKNEIEFEISPILDSGSLVTKPTEGEMENSDVPETQDIFQFSIRKAEIQTEVKTDGPNLSAVDSEQQKKAQDRIEKLKKFNFRRNFQEMESVPAYQRRNVQLSDVPPSSESKVSRYTLSEGDDAQTEIRPNNSFLHDNVD